MLRLLRLLIAAAAAVYLIVFAVQNRGTVDLVLWPGLVPISLPVWGLTLAAIVTGVVLSGIAIWLGGWGWRSRASEAQRKLRNQELRRQSAERREEEVAAQQAAARRKAAESQKGTIAAAPALAAPAHGTKPLALSSG